MTSRPMLRDTVMLCAVPVLLLIAGRITLQMAGGFLPDPNYGYLFNGLEILDLHPPSYYDHPGTTLEVLAAAVILLTWLIRLPVEMVGLKTSVFTRPEFYLDLINAVLVVLIAGAVFWFGQRLRDATGNLAVALTGQLSILLCYPAMIALSHVTPEPLLLAAGFTLAGLLAPSVLGGTAAGARTAKAIGLAIGFSIATKITAIPLILSVFFLPGRALQKRAALFAAGGLILFTLPTAHHYPQILRWIFNLSVHEGGYGSGPVGTPSMAQLMAAGAALIRQVPEIFIAAALYGVAALFGPDRARRLFTVSAMVLAVQILMCLKAAEARYLTPVVAIIALANAGLAYHALAASRRGAMQAAPGLLAGLFAVALACNAFSVRAWARNIQWADAENQALLQRVTDAGCGLVPYYSVRLPVYSITFGNEFTNYHFSAALRRQFPHAVTYDIAHKQFSAFGAPVATAEVKTRLAHGNCVRLVGSPVERHGRAFGIDPHLLTLVGESGHGVEEMAIYDYALLFAGP